MGVYLSPGVYVKETDLSSIIPAVATTSAALVGYSKKGTLDVKLVTNRQAFINEYGEPEAGNYFHYTALAFLEKGSALYCKRVVGSAALYGGIDIYADGEGSNDGFSAGQSEQTFYHGSGEEYVLFSVFAKDPGAWSDNVFIRIANVNDLYYNQDTDYLIGSDDEPAKYTFDIEVWYKDTNGVYTRVESWKVSRKTKIDGYGKQLYLETKINDYSNYIYVVDNDDIADTVVPETTGQNDDGSSTAYDLTQMDGGLDSSATSSDFVTGWGDFENPDDYDIRLLLEGGSGSVTVQNEMIRIAEARADCFAILDTPYDSLASVDDMVTFRRDTLNANTSYAALYAPWVRVNDPYNDKIVDIPPSGYVASQFAYNDYVSETWNAPAGFNRGLLNVLAITSIFDKGERDTLYQYQINPLQTFRGEGNVIWGQKTLQKKASALDRVNVRRLLIVIEKSISIALRYFTFEPNSDFTRFKVVAITTEYMNTLASRGAFQTEAGDSGFSILCDSTNNTSAVIDMNELHVDIFIKPIRAAEFIQLQAIITNSGASFNELISRGTFL